MSTRRSHTDDQPEVTGPLRVLCADEDADALRRLAQMLQDLGHEVVDVAIGLDELAAAVAEEDPDLTVVTIEEKDYDRDRALALIEHASEYASGPVILLASEDDTEFVAQAAERSIFAAAPGTAAGTLQGAIEVAIRRHAEAQELEEKVGELESALHRRAVIERAKGRLMERHGIDERAAFELVRGTARRTNRRVFDLAREVADGGDLDAPAGRS